MSGANGLNGGALEKLVTQAQQGNRPVHTGSLEPLAMLQAYRAGQPLVNPTFQRPAQLLPQALPTYIPPPEPVQAPMTFGVNPYGRQLDSNGPAGGADADGGAAAAAASAAAGDSVGGIGGGGGGGGGSK